MKHTKIDGAASKKRGPRHGGVVFKGEKPGHGHSNCGEQSKSKNKFWD